MTSTPSSPPPLSPRNKLLRDQLIVQHASAIIQMGTYSHLLPEKKNSPMSKPLPRIPVRLSMNGKNVVIGWLKVPSPASKTA